MHEAHSTVVAAVAAAGCQGWHHRDICVTRERAPHLALKVGVLLRLQRLVPAVLVVELLHGFLQLLGLLWVSCSQ